MRVSTEKLKELVAAALAQDKAAWDQVEIDFEAKRIKSREEWVAKNGEAWLNFADHVFQKIGDGKPITEEDLPHNTETGYNRIALFSDLRPDSRHTRDYVKGVAVYKPPRDLIQFQAFLDLVIEDTISTSALKDHGFANFNNRILQFLHDATVR